MQANKPDEPVITVKQEALIELLLSGIALPAAAKQLKVNESTCRRWLKHPAVKSAYRQARQEIFDDRLSLLRDGVNVAIKTLMRNMDDKVSPYVQVQAASKWLDTAVQVYKLGELEKEIEELKQALGLKELEEE